MKTLIAYSSKTGNTQKVAEAIHSSLENSYLKSIEEVENINDYDFIIVGGWIDRATFDTKALNFAKTISDRKVGYFFTLGAYPDSDHAKDCVNNINEVFAQNNNTVVENFFCQGAIDPKLIAWLSTLPEGHQMSPNPERKKRWADAASHPDTNDLENAKKVFSSINL